MPKPNEAVLRQALSRFEGLGQAEVTPLGGGLINDSYEVCAAAERYVLQRVSPIFDPAIHHNIQAVTRRLASAGLQTPQLLDSCEGLPWIDLGAEGIWRVMTFIEGASFDVVQGRSQAQAAGQLVGRFHAALDGLRHEFVGRRLGVHDTHRHLDALGRAVAEHRNHRLHQDVAPLAAAIEQQAAQLPPLPWLPERICHGDLKINNLRFAGPRGPDADRALCLIDLDTVGPMALPHELGDAWRSWCNQAGEDGTEAQFDMVVFEASWRGYRQGVDRDLRQAERQALLYSVEWISLELAARFAADALAEEYFGWDRARFPSAGEHNLLRARSQWSLHQAAVACRPARAGLLEVVG